MSNWKEDITKGETKVIETKNIIWGYSVMVNDGIPLIIGKIHIESNAKLIAESFNVFNETNKTPREQQETIKELLQSLGLVHKFLKELPTEVDMSFPSIQAIIDKHSK